MSVERHRRVKELFLDACELEERERRPFLEGECRADETLLSEVLEMLAADGAELPELESPLLDATESLGPYAPAEQIDRAAIERLERRASLHAYRFGEEVAEGGMGVILRVHDVDLGRDLAMKVSRKSVGGSTSSVSGASRADFERFLEEARITARLDHPGIVPVHDMGIDPEGRFYFTMKLVQGRELGEVFELAREGRQGWTTTRVVGVLLKVCEALAYAHDRRFVHRDLKPANIMVGDYGEAYVMDWGIVRSLDGRRPVESDTTVEEAAGELTLEGAILGTPFWMSPEQARGERVGPATDVYAMGAMLYQLLSGRKPYEEREGAQPPPSSVLLARLRSGPPPRLEELAPRAPRELVAIADRAMARRPEDRYPDMGDLAGDLRAFLEDRVVRAYRTGALAELGKWIRRNRLSAAALLAVVVSVIGGVLWSRELEAAGLRELDLASDYFRARVMVETTEDLWPAVPATIPALDDWIERAEALLERQEVHLQRMARLEQEPLSDETEVDRQRQLLAHLVTLGSGDGTDPALVDLVRDRRRFALGVEEASRTGPEVARLWEEACDAVASMEVYGGLRLPPQLGLVPLGPDPFSGLWEFAHLQTGTTPGRGSQEELLCTEESGLVFVLLPGGTFDMGAGTVVGGPNHDPGAGPNEGPVQEVTLAPFFLSKYELTQAQWQRGTRRNPSRWPAGERGVTALHPVEQVDWYGARDFLHRMELVLPTEARWEYACRAGWDTPFSCPSEEIGQYANVADRSYQATFAEAFDIEPFDDGFGYHAPVGSLSPNDFGLHDMHGNVLEWTLDLYGSLTLEREVGTGRNLGPTPGRDGFWSPDYRMVRGGGFEIPAHYARSSHRVNVAPGFLSHALGLRPARGIVPASR